MTHDRGDRDAPEPAVWLQSLGILGAIFLGCVLLVAVYAKALDPAAFEEQVTVEGLDFLFPARVVATIALLVEAAIGIALLLCVRRLWILVPAAVLVLLLMGLTGHTWWQAVHEGENLWESCGCFGNLVLRTPEEAFWQDLVLLVPACALAFLGRRRAAARLPAGRVIGCGGFVVAVMVFASLAPDLDLDDLATRLSPGVEVAEICAGRDEDRTCLEEYLPEALAGRQVVVIADLDDPALVAAVGELNAYADAGLGPPLWVLYPYVEVAVEGDAEAPTDGEGALDEGGGDAEEAPPEDAASPHDAFFLRHGNSFGVRPAPPPLLRPLYRRLPRSFLVEEGQVVRTHDGLPPLGDWTASP